MLRKIFALTLYMVLFSCPVGLIFAAEDGPVLSAGNDESISSDVPEGTSGRGSSWDLLGRKGGFFHPFLSLTEYYTDNVFYSNEDRKSDFVTILSPGIWLTVPHVREKLLHIDTATVSPGGFRLTKFTPETFRPYQLFAFYNADIERFSRYTSENTVNHRAQMLFQYNWRAGLSLEAFDQFIASHDVRGTGFSDRLDRFKNNLAGATAEYRAGDRFNFRIDYANFLVDYVASRNDFRDREDNAVAAYVFYLIRPRVSAFTEYEFVDIRYRQKSTLSDSDEHHFYGGVKWDVTAKSTGTVKGGYGIKKASSSGFDTGRDFIMEVQVDHKITPKTAIILKAYRQTNETNISNTDFILTNAASIEYLQRVTGKITASVKAAYSVDKYKGSIVLDGRRKSLRDNYLTSTLALQYKFKEWIELNIGYIFDKRDSNFSEFDYKTNIVFLRLTGSL